MLGSKNITATSTINGIKYEDYLSFKSMLPETLTALEYLQLRWIMTHISYFCSPTSIYVVCENQKYLELIKQSIWFINKDIVINEETNKPYDTAIIFDKATSSDISSIYSKIKPNGYLVLENTLEFQSELTSIEVGGLKIYRKPVQKEDIDFKIHVFIPVHNRIEQTLRCLHSIDRQTTRDMLTVTVIDDGSTDETKQKLEEHFPDVSIVSGNGALWWTGAIHKALELQKSFFKENDYFLLVNNDVILEPNTIFSLLNEAMRDRSLCLAPLGFTEDESIACGEAEDGHIFYRFEHSSKVMVQDNNLYPVMSLFGRCTLFPVEILENVDNFDAKTFPHYCGDADFCLRAAKFGYSFKICGKTSIRVQHDDDTTGSHHNFYSKRRSYKEVYDYLSDIRSLGNIKFLWRYYSRHYPEKKYKILLGVIKKVLLQTMYK